MQELFFEEASPPPQDPILAELVDAYKEYARMVRQEPPFLGHNGAVFNGVASYCRKHSVRPVFFVHAQFGYALGEPVTPLSMTKPDAITKYESWYERIPPTLVDLITTPFSMDVHTELETFAAMVLTKYGRLDYDDIRFKIACADPVWDVTAVARMILSDAHPLILKYYGKDYLMWVRDNKWKLGVLSDFGMDHSQIERSLISG